MAIDVPIEKIWKHKKSLCVAIINSRLGFRCGYCTVSSSHPFYKKEYNIAVSQIDNKKIEEVLAVHGGITYSGKLDFIEHEQVKNLWGFGFDCGHASDAPDLELVLDPKHREILKTLEDSNLGNYSKHMGGMYSRTHKTLEYVIENCNILAENLDKFLLNSIDFIREN